MITNKKQLIIIVLTNFIKSLATIILAIIIIYVFSAKIDAISKSIKEGKLSSSILQNKIDSISKLRNDFNVIGELDKKVPENIVLTKYSYKFTDELKRTVNAISPQQPTATFSGEAIKNYEIITGNNTSIKIYSQDYNLTSKGDIYFVISLLKAFNKLPYLANISSINISTNVLNEGLYNKSSSVSISGKLYTNYAD